MTKDKNSLDEIDQWVALNLNNATYYEVSFVGNDKFDEVKFYWDFKKQIEIIKAREKQP
jgi:hypothetical protein